MAGESPFKSSTSGASYDWEKFLAAKLIERSYLKLVSASVCEKVTQPKGTGTTAYFTRYSRMYVPVATLSEGVDPTDNTINLETFTATQDQWGDVLTLTDVAQLTQKHPLLQIAMDLLSDNAQRVMDREIQLVWLSGTNVLYAGTATTRTLIGATDYITDTLIHKARVTLQDAGAPPRDGPSNMKQNAMEGNASGSLTGGASYVAICGSQITADLMATAATSGLWAAVAQYQNKMAIYNGEVGTYLGLRWVETNFIPKFKLFGNTMTAVASAAAFGTGTPTVTAVTSGGTLTSDTTYYYKATRKNLLRGFEEEVSIEHTTSSTSTGNNESFTFAWPATAGYVYALYFGSTTGDANLKLVAQNIAAGATTTVTAVPSSTTTAPANIATTATAIHPIYVHGKNSCYWVGLQGMQLMLSVDQATTDNPLKLRRTVSYKFMSKAMLSDQTFMVRIEASSRFSV